MSALRVASLMLIIALAGCRTARDPRWFVPASDRGTLRHTTEGDVVGGPGRYGSLAWLGIPFAEPPVGPLRWRAPRPPKPWSGQRDALRFGQPCVQTSSLMVDAPPGANGLTGDEDCLTLNVYAPPDAKKLPVMVWIHGGGNSGGAASTYEGGHLATAQHVVVVTTQYRLGPLGWFRHRSLRAETQDALEQSGNFATLDLIRALAWVRDNAEAFGGDPNNVTIFGESAGGSNVMMLLVAKPARGLFHRAIIESAAMRPMSVDEAEAYADATPKGHVSSTNEVLVSLLLRDGKATGRKESQDILAKMSDPDIAAYLRSKTPAEILSLYPRIVEMVIAPAIIADGALLPAEGWNDVLSRADGWNRVPVLIGTNRDEFKLFMVTDPDHTWNLLGLLPRYRDEPRYQAHSEAVSRTWKEFGADAPAAAMLRSGATDVYLYQFDWRSEPRVLGSDLAGLIGAAHTLEIPFVFGHFELGLLTNQLFDEENREERLQLSDAMMGYWGTFAREGRPGQVWKAAPEMMVLDAASAGGQRMSSQTENIEKIVAAVDTDPRLKTQRDRCMAFHDLAFFRPVEPSEAYARMSRGACGDYAFERYPWR